LDQRSCEHPGRHRFLRVKSMALLEHRSRLLPSSKRDEGFAERDWSTDEPRPVMYLKQVGAGEVLYFTLGHARGHYDMRPLMDEYATVERGSWPVPAFTELLRRSLRWAAGQA